MKVTLINHMGTDNTVVDAARVSFAKASHMFSTEQNHKLIHYLARNNHWTPFGHCMATFHIEAPIFVARQLVKHQVGLVWNEASRRYIDSAPVFYIPDEFRSRPPASIKQGSGRHFVDENIRSEMNAFCEDSRILYNKLLERGVAPEQARTILPINMYTEWYWTGSLAAWSRVAGLRLKADAQYETREVVREIADECNRLWPISSAALGAPTVEDRLYEELQRIRRDLTDDLK